MGRPMTMGAGVMTTGAEEPMKGLAMATGPLITGPLDTTLCETTTGAEVTGAEVTGA